jgi:hypothetical protein
VQQQKSTHLDGEGLAAKPWLIADETTESANVFVMVAATTFNGCLHATCCIDEGAYMSYQILFLLQYRCIGLQSCQAERWQLAGLLMQISLLGSRGERSIPLRVYNSPY